MALLFYLIYGIWFLSEILLNVFMRSKNSDNRKTDKGSIWLIWILIIIGNFCAVYIANWLMASISEHIYIRFIGLALIILGVVLRLFIIASLGQFFTVDVTIKENHRLKKDGFYKYLRHPSYFASLLTFIGFGLSLNNWISLLIITILVAIAFIIRIRVEERALIAHFGIEYLEYKKRTKGLIPFIY
jgi:protein-S-isoprenylcysteine O-methyltransferase Ste14